MLNQIKNENLSIELIKNRADKIVSADNSLKNLLKLKSCQPMAFIQQIKTSPATIYFYLFKTKFGNIRIFCDSSIILAIDFDKTEKDNLYISRNFNKSKLIKSKKNCEHLFEKIFLSRNQASVNAGLCGSDFFIKILCTLCRTRPGELISYKKLGEMAGFTNAQRAVGTAMKNNPIPFLIPCHRVIKSNNTLGYYSGGTNRKIILILRETSLGD
ncbi:MAG: methylated-DNA--[protein]-cysteine S-methyltransferase [Desulfobacteraceae bacterium]|nr:methylated-DNA--[protein]-cysteine S-methyltransferase [Desulfobacteraceae bacterium]